MTDQQASTRQDQTEDMPRMGSKPPLTREQILQKLAEVAQQKKSARLAAEAARGKTKPADADNGAREETVKVVRTWLGREETDTE